MRKGYTMMRKKEVSQSSSVSCVSRWPKERYVRMAPFWRWVVSIQMTRGVDFRPAPVKESWLGWDIALFLFAGGTGGVALRDINLPLSEKMIFLLLY